MLQLFFLEVKLGSKAEQILLGLVFLHVVGKLELDDMYGPFQSKPFYDCIILWSLETHTSTYSQTIQAHSWPCRSHGQEVLDNFTLRML